MRALPTDVLHVAKIPELLADTPNPMLCLKGVQPEFYNSWQVTLPEDLSRLEQEVLSASTRKQIRKRTRQLESAGDLRHVIASTVAEKKHLFRILSEQRDVRFRALGRNNILASAPHRKFFDRILESMGNDAVVIHALNIGEETIAVAFGLQWQRRFYLLMSTMAHGRWMEMSPGIVLMWKLMTWSHQMGCRCFDFTIGDEAYKHQLGGRPRRLFEYVRCASPVDLYAGALWTRRRLIACRRWANERHWPFAGRPESRQPAAEIRDHSIG